MQPDIVLAQAGTLREWADMWERESLAGEAPGYNEVAFLLRRAANAACRTVGAAVDPNGEEAPLLPRDPQAEMRGD